MTGLHSGNDEGRHHQRRPTLPFARSTRRKRRRWPLVIRFYKGAIHGNIILPVLLHALFASVVAFVDQNLDRNLGLPASIIPSLSIVVGLMLVFRNQTSYNRFWDGRNFMTTMITSVRNLTRSFLACSSLPSTVPSHPVAPPGDTDRVVRILIAILYATKNHLRAGWGADQGIFEGERPTGYETSTPEFSDLLPPHFRCLQDDSGAGLTLQLTYFVETYIKRYSDLGVFHAPQASQLTVQLNALVDAYGKMETIRLSHIPIAILIHQKQVLALFGCVLPFALVDDMGWFSVLIVTMVCFTLYGIDGIASQLEDPFGFDKNDINMDTLVEDVREEVTGLLAEWRRVVGGWPTIVNDRDQEDTGDHPSGTYSQDRHKDGANGNGNGKAMPATEDRSRSDVKRRNKEMFIDAYAHIKNSHRSGRHVQQT